MLEARSLHFAYARLRPAILQDVSLTAAPGKVVGIHGESGAGKSTLARILCGHVRPDVGTISIGGTPLPRRGYRPIQLAFQSASSALNPRWTLRKSLTEAWSPPPFLLDALDISPALLDRYPNECSGGELQRLAVLRALAPRTRYLVCDESSAMIDPVNQVAFWRTILGLALTRPVGIIAISHNLSLLDSISDRILEMRGGKLHDRSA